MNPWTLAYTVKKEEEIVISTIKVPCLDWYGSYETAISLDGRSWRIAEGYDTEEEALKGHEKYAKKSKEEILELSYSD